MHNRRGDFPEPMRLIGRARGLFWVVPLVLVSSCVERYFTIKSTPPGASVYVNGRLAGHTPFEQAFTHYGTYRVDVLPDRMDDDQAYYLAWSGDVDLKAPWYQKAPWDFFAELLDPRTHVDRHSFGVELERSIPGLLPPDEADATASQELRARADRMREAAR